jgi:6-phosphogluconolactonase (cycloisomerase 2 family)
MPTALAVTPSDTFLYVGTASVIYGYSIGTGGVLTTLNNGSGVAIANVAAMDISPDGNWLLALDGNGITIDQFQINTTTGALGTGAGASYAISGATVVPRALKFAPNGDYVFLALGTAGDLVYQFNTTTGLLTSSQTLATVSTTTTDNALAVSPNSSYLYIARSGTSGGLAAYSIGTNGVLTAVTGSPFAAGTQPYSVVVNNSGSDVYVANRGDGTISGYSVASSGALTTLSGSPYTSGSAVTALAAERTGDYILAVASGGSPDLTMYSFDSVTAGKLDLSATTATGTDPTGPVAIAVTH